MINPNNTLIYHITSIDNLPQILQYNGLWCDEQRIIQKFSSVNIAHENIKQKRRETIVPLDGYNDHLSSYVPFYFCNRSPMLYAIFKNKVAEYKRNQGDIIYLVASVGNVINTKCKWCFTDGHAIEVFTQFYNSIDNLNRIDWEIINDKYWSNNQNDLDRKRRKQAEFLVYNAFLWDWVGSIGVIDQHIKDRVEYLLQGYNHRPIVEIKKEWYY